MANDIPETFSTSEKDVQRISPTCGSNAYERFLKWQKSLNTGSKFGEEVVLAYFSEAAKTSGHATLWSLYSTLKATIIANHNVDISKYGKLLTFLTNVDVNVHTGRKSVFTAEEIKKFLTEAPDREFLEMKAVVAFVICGNCRTDELTDVKIDHVHDYETEIEVRTFDPKSEADRVYSIGGELMNIVRNYMRLRPLQINTDRFFIQYREGKCHSQVLGKCSLRQIPAQIAEYLELPNTTSYNTFSFRDIDSTILAATGASFSTTTGQIQRFQVNISDSFNTNQIIIQSATVKPNNISELRIKQEDEYEDDGEYILSDPIANHYTTHDIHIKTEDENGDSTQDVNWDDFTVNCNSTSSEHHHPDNTKNVDISSPNPSKKLKYSDDVDLNESNSDKEMQHNLPTKSEGRYVQVYEKFVKWQELRNTNSFDEEVLLAYFAEIAKTVAPTSLYNSYSMLKSTIKLKHNVDLGHYYRLHSFLRKKKAGFINKKANVFSVDEINKFLREAPDSQYLAVKTVTVFGISGACRGCTDIVNVKTQHVKDYGKEILVRIPDSRTKQVKVYPIKGEFVDIVRKYMKLRPQKISTNRFFIQYLGGKCRCQHIGKHTVEKMPQRIAEYLGLPDAERYTGCSFRRTVETIMAGIEDVNSPVMPTYPAGSRITQEDEQGFEADDYILANQSGSDSNDIHVDDFSLDVHQDDVLPVFYCGTSSHSNSNEKLTFLEDVSMSGNTACQNSSLCQQKIKAQAEEIIRLKQLTESQSAKIESLEALLLDKLQKKY